MSQITIFHSKEKIYHYSTDLYQNKWTVSCIGIFDILILDGSVEILQLKKGKLESIQIIKGKENQYYKTEWINPIFGSIFARYSKNGEITFWKDMGKRNKPNWTCFSTVEGIKGIKDFKFAPEELGLIFAVSTSDDLVKLYQNDSLEEKSWRIIEELHIEGCQNLSWTIKNPKVPVLAVSCPDKQLVSIWYYNTLLNKWESRIEISCKSEIRDIKWSPYYKEINQILILMNGGQIKIANLENEDEKDFNFHTKITRSNWSMLGDKIYLYTNSENGKFIIEYSNKEWHLLK